MYPSPTSPRSPESAPASSPAPEAPSTPGTPSAGTSAAQGTSAAPVGPPTDINTYVLEHHGSPIRNILDLVRGEDTIAFSGGLPANELFDVEGVARAYQDVLLGPDGARALQYGPVIGEPEMREAAAKRLTESSCPASPDQILVTSGSQQGLGLAGQTLLNAGDVVLAENPTFVSALSAFRLQGAVCRGVESDEHGLVPADLERKILEHSPKALYTIPTFQNPTGVTMPAARRKEIADVLVRHSIWLIEDDPYSELRYEGEAVPAISADPRLDDKSLLLGTLSKVLSPGLRIGWVRGPEEIIGHMANAKQAVSLGTSTVDQLAAAHYIQRTDIPGTLVPVRETYAARRDRMWEVLPAVLPAGSHVTRPSGGMFMWATLPTGFDTSALVADIAAADTVYVPGSNFYVEDPDHRTIRFSFVSNTPDRIEEGLLRMQPVFEKAAAELR
ncbi:PLP-dependent aminotransferase family protein [Brevibacterium litoralis]|uniref:aminotransferase-like domain-containing protein n=1 Tax=Brevibacterium litoralis TaxID=3138935 RepID=UPI0032EFF7F0